jgi:hypothetical protein
MLSYPMLCHHILCYPILCHPIISYSNLFCALLSSCVFLSYPILSYAILSYAILRYYILSHPTLSYHPVLLTHLSRSRGAADVCCKVRPVRIELLPLDQQVVLCHSDVGEERERERVSEGERGRESSMYGGR